MGQAFSVASRAEDRRRGLPPYRKDVTALKKILALLLLAACLLSVAGVLACTPPEGGDATTTTENGGGAKPSEWADALDTEAVRAAIGGGELVVSCFERYTYEVYAEEDSKNTLDQMIYKRNKKLEERFLVTVKPDVTKSAGMYDFYSQYEYVQIELRGMDPSFDLIAMMASLSGRMISQKGYRDLYRSVPYVRESLAAGDPWWAERINRGATVNGRMFVAVSDMCITLTDLSYGMMFNRALEREYNVAASYAAAVEAAYTSMYDIVRAGALTLDSVMTMAKDFWVDNENAGTRNAVDEEDIIGFYTVAGSELDNFAPAFGFSYLANDGQSDPALWSHPSTFDTAVGKLRSFFYDTRGAHLSTGLSWDLEERLVAFAEGHVLFMTSTLDGLQTAAVKGMEQDYGILPYPKLDRDQTEYLTGVSDNLTVISVPRYIAGVRLRRAGAMTVALSAESYRSISDTYYEMIVKHDSGFVSRDDIEMLEYIMAAQVYDLATFHFEELTFDKENRGRFGLYLRYLMTTAVDQTPSGVWSSVADLLEGQLKTLIETYRTLPG